MNKSCYSNKWEKTVTQKLTKKDVCQQKRMCVNKKGCVSTKKDVCQQKRMCVNKKGCVSTKKDVCQQKRLCVNKKRMCVNKNGCVSTKKDVCLVNLYIYCYHLQIQSVEPTTCNMDIVNVWVNVNHRYLLNTIKLSLIVMSIQPVSTLSKAIKGKTMETHKDGSLRTVEVVWDTNFLYMDITISKRVHNPGAEPHKT